MWNSRSPRPLMRTVALLLATVLTFSVTADAFGLDPCPHHGVPATAATAATAAHPAPASHHHAMPTQAPQHHDAQHHDAQHGVCTCMGACAAAAAVPVPTAPSFAAVVTPVFNTHLAPSTAEAPASLYLALLPYGIAPPRADILL